jgi:hypothetical protein
LASTWAPQDREDAVLDPVSPQVRAGLEGWPGAGSNRRPSDFQRTIMFGAIVALTCSVAYGRVQREGDLGAYRARVPGDSRSAPPTGLIRRLRRTILKESRALACGSEPESRPDDRLPGFALVRGFLTLAGHS